MKFTKALLYDGITIQNYMKRLQFRTYQTTIRELNGYDEEYIEVNEMLPLSLLTTGLLSRTVGFETANESEIDAIEIIKDLTLGERAILVLQLRRLCLGENIRCLFSCGSCGELNSFDISTSTILETTNPRQEEYDNTINFRGYSLIIRPLTGRDQEYLLTINANTENRHSNMADQLARQSIVTSNPTFPENISLDKDFLNELSLKLSTLDPLSDIAFSFNCISCKSLLETHFIPEDFFFKELKLLGNQLEQEIHLLAFYYHWEESTILSLPITKRKKYLQLIVKTLSRGSEYE